MLCASPIISAVVYADDISTMNIAGARSIVVADQADQATASGYVYVLNNKFGFIADIDPRFMIRPKEDFRRFRMISASMQSQWSGPELFKQGVQVTARITDKEDLKSFEPNSKPDNVISNVSDVLVTTCQHARPVFDFSETDRNNDNGAGTFIDPEIEDAAIYNHEFTFNERNFSAGTFTFPKVVVPGSPATTTATAFAAGIIGKCWASMDASSLHAVATNEIMTAYNAKYGSFKSSTSNQGDYIYSCNIKLKCVIARTDTVDKLSFNQSFTNTTVASLDAKFFVSILQTSQAQLLIGNVGMGNARMPTNFTSMTDFNVDISLILEIPINGRIDQRISIPQDLSAPISRNMVGETPFYDENFLQPVTSVQFGSDGGFTYTAQYQTNHLFEFVLDDKTVLGTAAVAHAPNDSDSTVSKAQFDKFQKAMKGMPPALILNESGLTRTSKGQLRSRGVLTILHSLVAPLMSVMLPQSTPYVNAFGQTTAAIDAI